MNRTVYFADKAVAFTAETPGGAWYAVAAGALRTAYHGPRYSIFSNRTTRVAVVAADPDSGVRGLRGGVHARRGGGRRRGERLRGVADDSPQRPLGPAQRASGVRRAHRGVRRARGLQRRPAWRLEVVRPLCETLHAYYFPKTARWELKRTRWYELYHARPAPP